MDLRDFFKRIREIEAAIESDFTLVVSHSTGDGGKAGVTTETPRNIAARLIAEGRARLATPDEMEAHHAAIQEAVAEAEQAALADRVQVALVSDTDLASFKQKTKSKKGPAIANRGAPEETSGDPTRDEDPETTMVCPLTWTP